MPTDRRCEKCGATLATFGAEALCPNCMLREAVGLGAGDHARPPAAGPGPGATPVAPVTEKPGDRIGRYKLLQQIGEGGMGVVYMAEQEEPVRRRVALKVIKLGMDTRSVIARFEAERQALALMDHPNIAKVLDAGATESPTPGAPASLPASYTGPDLAGKDAGAPGDPGRLHGSPLPSDGRGSKGEGSILPAGRPYFVMELVRGIRITDYCDQNDLSTPQRLQLFTQVCQAIQHAHQKGVIHRDIKPSNILVTLHDGVPVPKIIDFGIAKATSDQRLTDKTFFTAFEQFLGTPAYMSPEQAELSGLDIDTRSDIYSLGVLLYELLTGQTPFESRELLAAGLDAMRRTIREKEPPKPSTRLTLEFESKSENRKQNAEVDEASSHRLLQIKDLIRLVRGDLDWIVMKALEKDRTRRYESANGLAMDIQRYLRDEPVAARPPSAAYRLQKAVRRNQLAFAAATAVTLTLVLGAIVSTWQAARAIRAERHAKNAQASEATQRQRAEQNAAESLSRLVRQYVANGNRLVDEGDLLGALPWFAQALKEQQDEPGRAKIYRLRLNATLQQCPKLVQIWFHKDVINDARFSPDGRLVVTASDDHTAQIWDATNGEPISLPLELPDSVKFAAFSPDGNRVAAACTGDSATGVWDVRTGRLLFPYLQHTSGPIEFSPDGRRLLTCGGVAQLWDAETGTPIGSAMKHDRAVAWAAFGRGGTRIITASADRTARIWDARTGQATAPPLKHQQGVSCVELSPDETLAATSSWDGTACLWDAKTGQRLHVLHHGGPVWRVAFSADGRRLVTASEDGTATVSDTKTGLMVGPPLLHGGPVADASFSLDGHYVVTCSSDGTARAWDADTGRPVSPPLRQSAGLAGISRAGLMGISFHPDGHRILTVSLDRAARVWDLAGGQCVFAEVKHPTVVVSASFSPDGSQVSSVSLDGVAYLWELATSKLLRTVVTNLEPAEPRGFTRDGRALVQCSSNGLSVVLDFKSGRAVLLDLNPRGRLNHAELSPDGRRMVTANSDHTARVWDVLTGKPVGPPMRHKSGVNYAVFSPDGRLVATASDDETARVWDSTSGEPVSPPLKHNAIVRSVIFGPDGNRLLTTSVDGRVQVFVLPTESRPLPDDFLLARLVAAHQIDDTGADLPVASEALESAWRTLRPKPGDAFMVTPDQVRGWERRENERHPDTAALSQLQTLWGEGSAFMNTNKWPEALEALSKATALLDAQPLHSVLATQIRDLRATAFGEVHRFREAIRDCDEAIWRWPDDYWLEGFLSAYHKRAGYHLRLGEFEQAMADFRKGLELDPGFINYPNKGATYHDNLARVYVLGPANIRSPEKALPLVQRAIELRSRPQYSNTLGVVYYRQGKFKEAIQILEKNVKTEQGLVTAWDWLCLAMSFQRLGETKKAEAYYTSAASWAKENGPSLRPLEREDLESIRAETEAVLGNWKKE